MGCNRWLGNSQKNVGIDQNFPDSTGFYVLPEFRTRTANKREWTRMDANPIPKIRVHSRLFAVKKHST